MYPSDRYGFEIFSALMQPYCPISAKTILISLWGDTYWRRSRVMCHIMALILIWIWEISERTFVWVALRSITATVHTVQCWHASTISHFRKWKFGRYNRITRNSEPDKNTKLVKTTCDCLDFSLSCLEVPIVRINNSLIFKCMKGLDFWALLRKLEAELLSWVLLFHCMYPAPLHVIFVFQFFVNFRPIICTAYFWPTIFVLVDSQCFRITLC